MTDADDEAVIDDALRRVREGDVAAFEPVVRRLERPLRVWLGALFNGRRQRSQIKCKSDSRNVGETTIGACS